MAFIFFFLPVLGNKDPIRAPGQSWFQVLARFDPLGIAILVPSIISLLLALQWGGVTYSWGDPKIIGLLLCFGGTILVWGFVQWWMGDNATISFALIRNRTVIAATLYTVFGAAAFMIVVYYVPTWLQAIKGDNAVQSGIHQLPTILSLTAAGLSAGGGVVLLGYTNPFLYLGSICMAIGGGLLYSLTPSSGIGEWVGYQIIFGIGIGASLEQTNIAIQAVLPEKLVPSGTSLTVFARSFAGSLSIAVAQNTFLQSLRTNLPKVAPGLDIEALSGSGATDLLTKVRKAARGDEEVVEKALLVYNNAVTRTFLVALVLGALTIVPALFVEWKSVKKQKRRDEAVEKA